ncbi:MAG: hypothetical protein PHI37_00660 [Candidatus Gracilibacteria bacterium]|nr:hypothetical protein [Candidatus Gracilibacteria bacterium]
MYSIKYSEEAFLFLDSFVNSYKDYFIRLYSDTGIDDEDLIIKNYLDIGNKLYRK